MNQKNENTIRMIEGNLNKIDLCANVLEKESGQIDPDEDAIEDAYKEIHERTNWIRAHLKNLE